MRIVAGIESLNLPSLFAAARKRIILHAAVYGPFANSKPHRDGLATALRKPSFERLDVIALDAEMPWAASFMNALRFQASKKEQDATLLASTGFLHQLKGVQPEKVHIHPHSAIPCLPILVVDDTVVFGQYAHSCVHAARGFWTSVEVDVEKLMKWARNNHLPDDASETEIAASRLVSECHHAMGGNVE